MEVQFLSMVIMICVATSSCSPVLKSMHLNDENKTLNNILIDSRNGYIYLTATNRFYARYGDLQPLAKLTLGPRNDSLWCSPNPDGPCRCDNGSNADGCEPVERSLRDVINKGMVLDANRDTLILCNNLFYGACSKIILRHFSLDDSYFSPVVFNSLAGNTVMLVVEAADDEDNLLVAASRDITSGLSSFKNEAHMLSKRNLDDFDIAHIDTSTSSTSFIDVRSQLREKFPVYFEYGFSYEGYSYFLGVRRKPNTNYNTSSFIVRVCNKDRYLHSFTETEIYCGDYKRLVAATFAPVGSEMAGSSGYTNALYATFIKDSVLNEQLGKASTSSALCVFSIHEVQRQVDDAIRICYSGLGPIGPEHITEQRQCEAGETVYCQDSPLNWPIQGLSLIPQMAESIVEHDTGAYVTTLAAKTTPSLNGNYTVVYMGTNNGSFMKMVLNDTSKLIFSQEDIGDGLPIKKSLTFTADKRHIYAFTDRKLMLVSLYNCSEYTTCEQCLAARDPHCGWCGLQNQEYPPFDTLWLDMKPHVDAITIAVQLQDSMKSHKAEKCMEISQCEVTHHQVGWLSYPRNNCPAITTVFPNLIIHHETNYSAVQLSFQNVHKVGPDRIQELSVQCELIGPDFSRLSQASVTTEGVGVSCQPFEVPPPLPGNQYRLEAQVALVVLERRWLTAPITLYNCAKHVSCEACTQPTLPCVWCLKSNLCVNRRAECDMMELQTAISSEMVQKQEDTPPFDRTGTQYCPKIWEIEKPNAYVTHDDTPIIVNVSGKELLDYHREGLRCYFDHRGGMIVNATWSGMIVCDAIRLRYDEDIGNISVPLQVYWDNNKTLDNPHNISVQLYKCSIMGGSCGECTLLDPNFKCGWCDDHCSLESQCHGGSVWHNHDYMCADPQIHDFTPKAAPKLGGTKVTITGINLGKTFEDVSVKVGGRPCKVIEELYVPSLRIVCTSAENIHETSGVVEVIVANMTARTTEIFAFKDPIVVGFSPEIGPVAGGTTVVVTGQDMEIGNTVHVFIGGKACEINSVQSKRIEFITAPQDESMAVKIKLSFDRVKEIPLVNPFQYMSNPRVSGLLNVNTLATGGGTLVIEGDNFYPGIKPILLMWPVERLDLGLDGDRSRRGMNIQMRVAGKRKRALDAHSIRLDGGRQERAVEVILDGTDGEPEYELTDTGKVHVQCNYVDRYSVDCPWPNLSPLMREDEDHPEVPTLLNYDVTVDDWSMRGADEMAMTSLEFEPIRVYRPPVVHGVGEDVIPFEDEMQLDIAGENLHVLRLVTGLQVQVGNSTSDVINIQRDYVTIVPPADPRIINDAGNSVIIVKVGRWEQEAGFIKYRTATVAEEDNTKLGIIIGVIVTILVIGIIIIFIVKYRKRRSKGQALPMRVNNGSVVERVDPLMNSGGRVTHNENGENSATEMVPLKTMTEEPQGSGEEEEEDVLELHKPFELCDFLDNIRDPKLREQVREVIVPPERLEMKDMIGRGNFGCVYLAILKSSEHENYRNTCRVAVKTLQGERLEQATVESFLKEGVIMKNFDHPHVLKLLGVCVTNHENPMVILPYMANGDLRSYVKDKKKNFTARQLLHLAQQVAEGMAYLSSLNFVHRDLAARNCMIDELDDVKVADFGLTRDLFEKQYYSTNLKEKRGKMPIKWMALESLEEFIFTTKSDVWSFGVLMWELMTRGVTPYPDVDIFDVRNYLASGRRLRKPKYCPENIYKIMLDCWHADPDIRPSFIDLVNRIELLLNPPKKRVSEELNEPMYMNIRKANSTEYLRPSETPGVQA